MQSETKGVICTLVSAALWGAYPIITKSAVANIPPFTFSAILAIFVTIVIGIWIVASGKLKELAQTDTYFSLLMISIFIIVVPNLLFFAGLKHTSGINASVLMLSEMIFTLIFTPFFGERNTTEKYIGAISITLGAFLVLYDGSHLSFNIGDLLITLSTITYPIGNFYSKRALYKLSPSSVIFARYLIGGIFLLVFALFAEPEANPIDIASNNLLTFVLIATFLVAISKMIFYEGMKSLDISKIISLTMTFPLFSLIVLLVFYDAQILTHQIIGVVIMVFGAFYAVRRKSENHKNLKYKR